MSDRAGGSGSSGGIGGSAGGPTHKITSVAARVVYNSRGSRTIEADVVSDYRFRGRTAAPSGASVGRREAAAFPEGGAARSAEIIVKNAGTFAGLDPSDIEAVHGAIRSIDPTEGYTRMGGAAAFAVSIAAAESAAIARAETLFHVMEEGCRAVRGGTGGARMKRPDLYLPRPLGNILGGGAHAGAGAPDIQEILVCAVGARTVREAVETNIAVHAELGAVLQRDDPMFSGGKGDEGGWAPRADNERALELAARACESLGYTLGKEVALGVDFASSTQWDEKAKRYKYARAGASNTPGEQVEFASSIIDRYKLAYAEDAVHEDDFDGMAEVASRCPRTLVTGDDLTVTSAAALRRAVTRGSCNAAILKVNQAGGLRDAAEFAAEAAASGVRLVTSHRSGETPDAHIAHVGIATSSAMLKAGIVGGERVAKLNELVRVEEEYGPAGHGLIKGIAAPPP